MSRRSGGGGDPGPIPGRWLTCPRKSDDLIGGKFLALKTPLDERYDAQVQPQNLFYPAMVFSAMKGYKVKIGLWVDLTNTSRFYDRRFIEEQEGCRYLKIKCRGHGETPNEEQVNSFIFECNKHVQQNPLDVIAVHCTHGFNRTGFLIAAFLIQTEDWSPEAAVEAFAKSRPPGIYKGDYLRELFKLYGDETDAPAEPQLPEWCFEEEEEDDDLGGGGNGAHNNSAGDEGRAAGPRNRRRELNKKNPQFMEGVPGVRVVTDNRQLRQVQARVQDMCGWRKSGFPGAQPVSLDRENLAFLSQRAYKVSWKADGTRYMMLIDGKDQTYFIDRDNCVFQVDNITFLHRKDANKHIGSTLLDGEMVIDEVSDQKFPRYLVYDVIQFEGQEVGKTIFSTRLLCVDKEIVKTRAKYVEEGRIDRASEPFSVRAKQFWPLNDTGTLLGPKFTKASLGHEPDGLVFQPSDEAYKSGRDDNILKWKPHTHNSVDFKLQVVKENRPGMLPETKGLLYVGGLSEPFAYMYKMKKEVRELNNRIIECTYDMQAQKWVFMRERTDKSYPNGFNTAKGVVKSIQYPVTEKMLLEFIERHQFRRPVMQQQQQQPQHQQSGPSPSSSSSSSSSMMPPPNKRPRVQS